MVSLATKRILCQKLTMTFLATVLCAALVVTDGDTILCNEERIRILGVDAPETRFAQCDAEYRLGIVAKLRLEELVREANLEIRRNGRDRYDGTLAQIIVDGMDVAELLSPKVSHVRANGRDVVRLGVTRDEEVPINCQLSVSRSTRNSRIFSGVQSSA